MKLVINLNKETDKRFKHLLGKKVKCVHEGRVWKGELQFAGVNHQLHGQFQVTLGRTPLWPVDPNTIKEYINTQKVF